MDGRSQTNRGSTLTSRIHGAICRLFNVLEELRLGSTGITKQENINITTDSVLSLRVLGDTSKHGKCKSGLDIIVSENRGSNGLNNLIH